MTIMENIPMGLETRFIVVVDDVDLGGWNSCKNLSVNFHLEQVEEGGEYGYKHWLPGCVEYPTITLERAMIAADAARVQAWLALQARQLIPGTAQITLLDAHVIPVYTWSLRNVYPMSWKGPNLSAGSSKVAMETLELAHEGFL